MVAGGMAIRGVHSRTRDSMWARPWSREWVRSWMSWGALSVARLGLGGDGPDGGYPGQAGVGVPELGEIVPGAGADGCFDSVAAFEGEQGGVADEQGGVGPGRAWTRGWRELRRSAGRCCRSGGRGLARRRRSCGRRRRQLLCEPWQECGEL